MKTAEELANEIGYYHPANVELFKAAINDARHSALTEAVGALVHINVPNITMEDESEVLTACNKAILALRDGR